MQKLLPDRPSNKICLEIVLIQSQPYLSSPTGTWIHVMRFQAQPLLETFFRVHRFHRWLAFSLPPWWENSQLKKLEGRFRERITTLLRIMSLFYHLILPKQIKMASLLFIQSELPDEVMTDEVFRVVARGQPFRNFSSYSTLQFFTINVNLLFRTSKYLEVEQVIHPPF